MPQAGTVHPTARGIHHRHHQHIRGVHQFHYAVSWFPALSKRAGTVLDGGGPRNRAASRGNPHQVLVQKLGDFLLAHGRAVGFKLFFCGKRLIWVGGELLLCLLWALNMSGLLVPLGSLRRLR